MFGLKVLLWGFGIADFLIVFWGSYSTCRPDPIMVLGFGFRVWGVEVLGLRGLRRMTQLSYCTMIRARCARPWQVERALHGPKKIESLGRVLKRLQGRGTLVRHHPAGSLL